MGRDQEKCQAGVSQMYSYPIGTESEEVPSNIEQN